MNAGRYLAIKNGEKNEIQQVANAIQQLFNLVIDKNKIKKTEKNLYVLTDNDFVIIAKRKDKAQFQIEYLSVNG